MMTDVLQIAQEIRSQLSEETEKLEEFIRRAGQLLRSIDEGGSSFVEPISTDTLPIASTLRAYARR